MLEAAIVGMLVVVSFFVGSRFLGGPRTEPERVPEGVQKVEQPPPFPFHELAERVERLEMRFGGLVDEVTERANYAKGTWKKVAAAQRTQEEPEEEPEPLSLPFPDEEGGGEEGMHPMRPHLVSRAQIRKIEKRERILNRRASHG